MVHSDGALELVIFSNRIDDLDIPAVGTRSIDIVKTNAASERAKEP